ncbi:alpha/beta fold hydrolase [Dictyobacter formicarum]|uniref:Alpha/beta hydrolase n=1 Tax=Dictyobacter formicarum TaxID=2778368 RepID=A0ABQ3VTR4_9CHLR|nr:alpha/beta hydrolase [Dictyobacter formicarum]GHO88501.1 alpha/beta hydrolase [Dictyobacter formicarum]
MMIEHFNGKAKSNRIVLPAGEFHYLSWGAERDELPACVLLHGITSSSQSWVRVGPVLAERYRVFALDMRGHGDSIKPAPGAYSLRETAADAEAFIQILELQSPLLIGHSWGGATALVLASGNGAAQPGIEFSQIILEDPAHNFGHGDPEQRAARFTADIGVPADVLRASLIANNPGWTEEDIEGKLDAASKVSKEAVVSVFADTEKEGDLLPLLSRLTAPTLVVRADRELGSTLNDNAWAFVQAQLTAPSMAVEIEGASHNIHRTSFTEFMRTVDAFLNANA